MASLNKIQLIGNVGKDSAEMRMTPSGKEVASVSIAVTRKFGENEATDWFNVELWGALAEAAVKHLITGREAYIEGRLQFDKWTDKEGNKRTAAKVVASGFQITNWRDNGEARPAAVVEDDLDIPMAG